jgi:very-short-patch-repair endonuclease
VGGLPDPEWYFEHVLQDAEPGRSGRVARGAAQRWQEWWRAAAVGEPIVRLAASQGFVVTVEQAAEYGYGRRRIATAIRRGRWTGCGCRGVVAPLVVTDDDQFVTRRRKHTLACAAAALKRSAHVVSGRSAAIMQGLPTIGIPSRPELTGPLDQVVGRRPTAHVFAAGLPKEEHTRWFGVSVTEPTRTVLDVARHDRREGVVVADAALRERLASRTDLERSLDTATGWPWVRRARWVVRFADARAESPLESLVRLAMHDDGFPRPELQVEIAGYRVDLLLEDARLIIEADGRAKYTDDALWREKLRQQALHRQHFEVERVLWDDVTRSWPATADRLREAMRPR